MLHERSKHKKLHTVGFQLYEILGKKKSYNYRKQMSSCLRSGVQEGNPIRRDVRTLTG